MFKTSFRSVNANKQFDSNTLKRVHTSYKGTLALYQNMFFVKEKKKKKQFKSGFQEPITGLPKNDINIPSTDRRKGELTDRRMDS